MVSLFRCVKNCLRLWHCAFLYRYCLGLETSILYWELGLNSSLVLMKTCGWLIWSFKFIHTMGGVFPIFFLGIIVYILILAKLSSDAGCCCFHLVFSMYLFLVPWVLLSILSVMWILCDRTGFKSSHFVLCSHNAFSIISIIKNYSF